MRSILEESHTYIYLLVNVIAEQCALECFQKTQQNKKRLMYQLIVYKYYLYLNQRWKGIIELIFPSASSSPLFPSHDPHTYITTENLLLPTFKISKLPNL